MTAQIYTNLNQFSSPFFAGIVQLVRHQEEGWAGACCQVQPLSIVHRSSSRRITTIQMLSSLMFGCKYIWRLVFSDQQNKKKSIEVSVLYFLWGENWRLVFFYTIFLYYRKRKYSLLVEVVFVGVFFYTRGLGVLYNYTKWTKWERTKDLSVVLLFVCCLGKKS